MITLEKRCKSNFLVQKMTPKLVVLHSLKKLQVSEKNQFFKKNTSSLFVQTRSSKRLAEIILK